VSKPRQQASDAVTLLLSLVPFLEQNSPISVAETAAHFQTDDRAIRQAVDLLVTTGVPDMHGHIWTGDMFDIDFDLYDDGRGEIALRNSVGLHAAPRLSAAEAAAVAAGLSTLIAAASQNEIDELTALQKKISQGSADPVSPFSVRPTIAPASVKLAAESISTDKKLSFTYRSLHNEVSQRVVDALRVDYRVNQWFVRAWCHDREAVRTFRADRIANPQLIDEPRCSDHLHAAVSDELFVESSADILATVRYPLWASLRIAAFAPTITDLSDDFVTATVRFGTVDNAIRCAARNAGLLEIVAPESLRDAVRQWATGTS